MCQKVIETFQKRRYTGEDNCRERISKGYHHWKEGCGTEKTANRLSPGDRVVPDAVHLFGG